MRDEIEADDAENAAHEAEIVDPARPAGGLDKLLTRSEAAKKLGLSVSTIRRMEGSELKPIIGQDGVHYFQETELLEVFVRVRRVRAPDVEHADGALAARAFELFRGGADVIAVVRELSEPPERIEKLFKQWQKLRRIIFFDAKPVDDELFTDAGPEGLTTEAGLLTAVRNYMKRVSPLCVLCDGRGYWCRRCAQKAGRAQELERRANKLF